MVEMFVPRLTRPTTKQAIHPAWRADYLLYASERLKFQLRAS
jgi:hypothetical protein